MLHTSRVRALLSITQRCWRRSLVDPVRVTSLRMPVRDQLQETLLRSRCPRRRPVVIASIRNSSCSRLSVMSSSLARLTLRYRSASHRGYRRTKYTDVSCTKLPSCYHATQLDRNLPECPGRLGVLYASCSRSACTAVGRPPGQLQ